MLVLHANNVNDAYSDALWNLRVNHSTEGSRNGSVKTYPTPVSTVYQNPTQRMLFDEERNANPYFHIMESIWMLAGRNDVEFVKKFAGNMGDFSDDGITLNGAYGYRWRKHFDTDQLKNLVGLLQRDHNTRRAVVAMWDGLYDGANLGSKDLPCNTHIYFRIREGKLDMTVCNRSNDVVWGCYGANAVHMSVLQEFIALAVGVPIGTYTQVSNDWHIYEKHWPLLDHPSEPKSNLYNEAWVHTPLIRHDEQADAFLRDCAKFVSNLVMDDYYGSYDHSYINWVLQPMAKSWKCYKEGSFTRAVSYATTIPDTAVKLACLEWLERREK